MPRSAHRVVALFHHVIVTNADIYKAVADEAYDEMVQLAEAGRRPKPWMLVGSELFERLRRDWECLEVFPQATMFMLDASVTHMSKPEGVAASAEGHRAHYGLTKFTE